MKINRHFGGTCHLHIRGRRISKARNQHEAGSKQSNWLVLHTLTTSSPSFPRPAQMQPFSGPHWLSWSYLPLFCSVVCGSQLGTGKLFSYTYWFIVPYVSACYLLHDGFSLGLFINPKMEATCFSKTSVDFQWTTWHYIPEDGTLQRCAQFSISMLHLCRYFTHHLFNRKRANFSPKVFCSLFGLLVYGGVRIAQSV
jgi:hypothetical protein